MRRTFVSLCVLHAVSPLAWAEPDPISDPARIELQALNITGSADSERADGPVVGYKATRSASATRTDTSIHETPQSISVVSNEQMENLLSGRLDIGLLRPPVRRAELASMEVLLKGLLKG